MPDAAQPSVQTSVTIVIEASLSHVFETAAGMDPRELIRPYGPLPGIDAVEGHDGAWSAPGQRRRYLLTDKSSVNEELTGFTRDHTYAYAVSGITGPFSAIVREARAEWHFTKVGAGKSQIDWTYFFTPSGPVAEPVLWFIVKMLWPGYLRAALTRVKQKAERAHEDRDL